MTGPAVQEAQSTGDRSRRRIRRLGAVSIAAVILMVALAVAAWGAGVGRAPAMRTNLPLISGDPHGAIMKAHVPVSDVIPGHSHLTLMRASPWPVVPNLFEQEPLRDSCDGIIGTFGWDNPFVSADLTWTGTEASLARVMNQRLARRGFTQVAQDAPAPAWASGWGDWNWLRTAPGSPKVAVELTTDSLHYRGRPLFGIEIEAPPDGGRPSGS